MVAPHPGVKNLVTRGQKDRPYLYFELFGLLMKVDGFVFTHAFANATFLLLEVKAAFMYISDKRNGLREIYVNRFVRRQVLIVWIGYLDRAVLYTGITSGALVLYNVSGFFIQGDPEVSCLPFNIFNISIRHDLYIGMPADLDQFGREYSSGAFIGRKGLVKLGHMAANGR